MPPTSLSGPSAGLLSGPRLPPASGSKPRSLVVLLHGLGADGDDLIGLAAPWAPALSDAAFVAPNAPFACDMAPFGFQWFSLQDRAPARLLAGAEAVASRLDAFLDDALAAHGLTDDRLALVGFSQGTMMALHVALRRPRPCAGVLGYAGALIGGLEAGALARSVRSRPPVLLVHGDADPIVPFQAMALAAAALRGAGVPVETVARPGLGHAVDQEGIRRGLAFLETRLAGGAPEQASGPA